MPVGFEHPWVLLALPLLLLLPRGRGFALRLAALALLVAAVARPTLARPGGEVAVLIDVSASVGPNAVAAAGQFVYGDERPLFYQFAGDTARVGAPAAPTPAGLATGVTDVARALQVAAADGARRALLISDGVESAGAALESLPPFPVDALEVERRPNARLAALLAPEQAAPGQTVEAVAVVESDRAATVTLEGSVNGAPLPRVTRDVPAGRTAVPLAFTADETGSVRLEVLLEADFDQPTADDRYATEIAVTEQEPVLVLGDPALARLLRTQGLQVVEGGEELITAPLAFSAVVLRASAGRFTPGQLELLRSYVENGGGLLMTGGPDSFGFGSWYRTPVEEVLPVDTDLRTSVDLPLVALVIILDRSQSMSTGNPSRLELAKRGAIGVVELAYQEDLLGLVAFSDESEWIFRLRPATERGKREMLNAILGLSTQGGTILGPAYEEAVAQLRATPAAVKHVIVLSDGKLYDGQGPFGTGRSVDFGALARDALADRITTSTIAIGDNADFARLEAIARAGGGRYHQALDVNTLPQIFTSEALTATRSLLRDEPVEPIAHQHPLSPLSGPQPPVSAYIATSAKPDAEQLLTGIEEEPILAVRRHGLGRTAALTTDLGGWAGEFGRSPQLPALLGATVRWLQARPAVYSATVTRDAGELAVVVDAVQDGEYVNDRALLARFGGEQRRLEQVAPGRYEGRLPAGGAQGTLLVSDGPEIVARAQVGGADPEFEPHGGRALLRSVTERTGGQLLEAPGEYDPLLPRGPQPLWPVPAAAAALLFLLELTLRRYAPGRAGRARTAP